MSESLAAMVAQTSDLETMDGKRAWLRAWAADHGLRVEFDGEVGFGRPCVGMLHGTSYVDTPGSAYNDYPEDERIRPPDDVAAYHKHDCLAVLGHGDDAVDGLYRWVRQLDVAGASVVTESRKAENIFDFALHGGTTTRIVLSDNDGQEER